MPVVEGLGAESCEARELSWNGFREEENKADESSVWRRLSVTFKVLPKSREGDVDMDRSLEVGLRSEGCRVLPWNDANDDKLRAVELTPRRTLNGSFTVLLILVEVNFAVGNTKLVGGTLKNEDFDERVLSWNSVSEEKVKFEELVLRETLSGALTVLLKFWGRDALNEVDRLDTKPEEAFKVGRVKDSTLKDCERELTWDDSIARAVLEYMAPVVVKVVLAVITVLEVSNKGSLDSESESGKDGDTWTSDDFDTRTDVKDESCTVSLADNAPLTENVWGFNPTESLEGIDGDTDTSEECSARTGDDGEYFNVWLEGNAPLTFFNVSDVNFKVSVERRNVDCTGLTIVEREYFFDKFGCSDFDPDEIDVLARDETAVKVAEPFAAKVDSPFWEDVFDLEIKVVWRIVGNANVDSDAEAVENFDDNFDLVEGGCASVEVK